MLWFWFAFSVCLSFWFALRAFGATSALRVWHLQSASDNPVSDEAEPTSEGAEWPLSGCPPAQSVRCTDAARRRTAAVYIVGIKARALLNTTMVHVLRRCVDDGFAVHVYLSLIFDTSGTGNWLRVRQMAREDPAIEHLSRRGLQQYVHDLVRRTGACMLCAEIPQRPPEYKRIPVNPGQLREYPPHNNSAGRRVLNVWFLSERLWNATLRRERASGKRYEFLVWVRDDAYWVADIPRPSALMEGREAARTMWSLSCRRWGGVNDRVMMMGRAAAPALLTMFSGFMRGGFPGGTRNAEVHLLRTARLRSVVLRRSTIEELPCTSAMVYGAQRGPALCIVRKYWCGNASGVSGLRFCEDIEQRARGVNQSTPRSTTTFRPPRRS